MAAGPESSSTPAPVPADPATTPSTNVAGLRTDPVIAPAIAPGRTVDDYLTRRQRIEEEYREVQHVAVLFGAILIPVLVGWGWAYRAGDIVAADLWCGGALYAGIVAFAFCWRDALRGKWQRPRLDRLTWPLLLVAPIGTLVLAGLADVIADALAVPTPNLSVSLVDAGYTPAQAFVWLAVLPAIFEEVAFRGLMLTKLQRVCSPVQAMWVSAILFATIHFALLSLAIFLVPLGLLAAYLVRRTGSLWPAIWLHFAHNASVVAIELYLD